MDIFEYKMRQEFPALSNSDLDSLLKMFRRTYRYGYHVGALNTSAPTQGWNIYKEQVDIEETNKLPTMLTYKEEEKDEAFRMIDTASATLEEFGNSISDEKMSSIVEYTIQSLRKKLIGDYEFDMGTHYQQENGDEQDTTTSDEGGDFGDVY